MADYRTDEEQIELIKKWWLENGRSTIAGVVIALVAFFGWSQWQSYQRHRAEAASDLFQQMIAASESVDSAQKVTSLAELLRKDYANTIYATFAGLRLAKDAVAANKLPEAVQFLEWVQKQGADVSLLPLVSLRLAQVQFAQNDLDKALATLNGVKSTNAAWQGAIAELRGDIQAEQGKTNDARMSYEEAKQVFEAANGQEKIAALEVKLSSLPPVAATHAETSKKP